VSLRELIADGYIQASDIPALNGMEITLVFTFDEAQPEQALVRVRNDNGAIAVARLADGKISSFPR